MGEIRRAAGQQAGRSLCPRLLNGVAADVRLEGGRTRRFVGDGLVCAARLRVLERRYGRLRAIRQEPRHYVRHRQRRRRPGCRDRLHQPHARRAEFPHLRHFFGCAARGTVRAKASGSRRAPGARRIRLDRRRKSHTGAAAQKASGVSQDEAPANRPRVRLFHFRARSSRVRRKARRRRIRRRDPRVGFVNAEWNVHRHVLEVADRRSRSHHGADDHHARRVRRHRRIR